ncbi:MAG TPA: hypothetical protein VGM05_05310 [Planctomycetaceae bacterium]
MATRVARFAFNAGDGEVVCRERLGGLLKHYQGVAASMAPR